MSHKTEQISWRKLDNTAKLFPVIANEKISHTFRISVTLKQAIQPELLQQALEDTLPWFDGYRVRLRRGFFWFYFENNKNKPMIVKEQTYPCKFIDPHLNQKFLFQVSYYDCRINLEVFHALSDGLGAVTFLKQLTYRYLDLIKEKKDLDQKWRPERDCILDVEDSYVKNYKKRKKKRYSTKKAYQLKGQKLYQDTISVIHGYVNLTDLKARCKKHNVSMTKYLTAVMIWSIYEEYLNGQPEKRPICINLPVNLRAFFDSSTTSNFFMVTMIDFLAQKEGHTFEEILKEVSRKMDEKITRERVEETIAYNVSAEQNPFVRILPLFIKNLVLNFMFQKSSKSVTMTLSNLGKVDVLPEYEDEIKRFHAMMGVFKKQEVKCTIMSYEDEVVVTFTSVYKKAYLQKTFFRTLSQQGIRISIESNGVINEKV
ncbi:MAG: hypothetical protein ACOX1S_08565 [Anaerostipes sp.]|jgi:hypothetical protein